MVSVPLNEPERERTRRKDAELFEATPEQIARMEASIARNKQDAELDAELDDSFPASDPPSITERLLEIIPTNPVAALADGDVLAIIFFSI